MPTYDYECRACKHKFEAFQNMSDDTFKRCPECSADELRRIIGAGSGIIFKGSGFYVNDSRKKTAASSSSDSNKAKSSDKKSSSNGKVSA